MLKRIKEEPVDRKNVDDKFTETIKALRTGLDQLEKQFPVYSPDLQWFEQQVTKSKIQIRLRLVRELTLFFLIAIAMISGIVLTILKAPMIYIFLQLFLILSLPVIFFAKKRRQVEENE